jgi:hypothetical protein
MRDVCSLICLALIGLFRSRASLQAEILTLRHQLNVLRRKDCRFGDAACGPKTDVRSVAFARFA